MNKIYSNIRGTSDFSPLESLLFRQLGQEARKVFKAFGYEEVILPFLEEKGLFSKGVGEGTDIAERQMFKIEGKDIVLRPEGTAQIIRYYIQNALYKQSSFHKFFYTGAMFRGERPQKGRLRQFHHIGAEAIGSNSIYLDAEMIDLSLRILDCLGVQEKELKINTLGCASDKLKFSDYLRKALEYDKSNFCDDCRRRLNKNPLRVLDCKNKQCKEIAKSLNLEQTHICQDCKNQFKDLLSLFDDLGIKYTLSPYLVRGLDYYTNTVFEISSSKLGSQDAIGAGGRYNNLIQSLGGPDIPAVGFALGLERILLALDKPKFVPVVDVFVAVSGQKLLKSGFDILRRLREQGINSDYDYCAKSLKGQLRFAQKKGARFVVIVGEDELKEKSVMLKNMEKSTQEKVKIEELIYKINT
ncbi:MAG: histidine--tRNA ligase [Candidatus Omnitrophota bacterium]